MRLLNCCCLAATLALGTGKVQGQTFNPTKVPIITRETELRMRVLEGHSQRLAEIENQIRKLNGKLNGSTPSYNPYKAPKSATPAVWVNSSSSPYPSGFSQMSHIEKMKAITTPVRMPAFSDPYESEDHERILDDIISGPIGRNMRPGQTLHILIVPDGTAHVWVK